MNIFALSSEPKEAARWHNDKHVVKMITETAQMLCTAHRVLDGSKTAFGKRKNFLILPFEQIVIDYEKSTPTDLVYKLENQKGMLATHVNHPCAAWVRESAENYNWALDLWEELLHEWRRRYKHNKIHASQRFMGLFCTMPKNIPDGKLTPFALAMPDEYKISDDPVLCYRQYYKLGKAHLANWRNTDAPPWFY